LLLKLSPWERVLLAKRVTQKSLLIYLLALRSLPSNGSTRYNTNTQWGRKLCGQFNVQNIVSNSLLIGLQLKFENIRRSALLNCVIKVVYEHFQSLT
jgi:hypothetical protein